jgi:hypothetical protein
MSGKKARGRANRAKRGAAAVQPGTQQVENSHEATGTLTHNPGRLTRAQLYDTLKGFIENALEGIEHENHLWVASEFTGDVAALAAAAEGGDMKAQVAMIIRGEFLENKKWHVRAEAQGNMNALLWLALFMVYQYLCVMDEFNEGLESEAVKERAMTQLRVPADRGLSTAQHALGMLMYFSQYSADTKSDLLDAARWIRKAAMQGVMDAQYELGEMFRHGVFCDHIYMRFARKYIRRASVQGHVEAIVRMKDLRSCVMCGTDDAPLACSLCRRARYCNSTCSGKHWCEGGGVGGGVSGGAGAGGAGAQHKLTCPRTHTRV